MAFRPLELTPQLCEKVNENIDLPSDCGVLLVLESNLMSTFQLDDECGWMMRFCGQRHVFTAPSDQAR